MKIRMLLTQMDRSERARASRQYGEYETLWKQLEEMDVERKKWKVRKRP